MSKHVWLVMEDVTEYVNGEDHDAYNLIAAFREKPRPEQLQEIMSREGVALPSRIKPYAYRLYDARFIDLSRTRTWNLIHVEDGESIK